MNRLSQWQLDSSAPELYERFVVPVVARPWADDLVARARLHPHDRVLDVACGTGVVARTAAAQLERTGRVSALDLNAGMLAVARSLPAVDGPAIQWHEGSVDSMPFDNAAFDVVLCQLGLQFFPDRYAALRQMRRVLALKGRLALNVFSAITKSPGASALVDAFDVHIGSDAGSVKRTEHALADSHELRTLVEESGFADVDITTVTKTVYYPSAADYVRIQLTASPLAGVIANLDKNRSPKIVDAIFNDVCAALAPYEGSKGLALPQEVHVLLAVKGTRA